MAESKNGWFNSWLNAAKHKSTEVLEFVKKDLEEFGSTVKNEANNVVSTTGTAISKTLKLNESDSAAGSMKRSISSFLGQMNNILNPSPDDSDTEAIMITEDSDPITLTKLQQAIYNLQKNERTFLDDPEIALKTQFNCWLEIMEDQLSEDRLNKHLSSSVTLKAQYEKLVPERVSHQLFWKRYLFKKALIEDDMARQEAMEKREQKEKLLAEEHLKWEQEDFATDIELSEEEQIRLLEQYEAETKQRKNGSWSPNKVCENTFDIQGVPSNSSKYSINETTLKRNDSNVERKSNVSQESCRKRNNSIMERKSNISLEQNDDKMEEKSNISEDSYLERNDDHFKMEEANSHKSDVKMQKTNSHNSLDIEIKSCNSSSDGDWEKINNDETL